MIVIIILLLIVCGGLWLKLRSVENSKIEVVQINEERKQEAKALEQAVKEKREELDRVHQSVEGQSNVLSSFTKSINKFQDDSKEQAQQIYQTQIENLKQEYEELYNTLDANLETKLVGIQKKICKEEEKLADLEAKQLAYIKAQQREEEIAANQDYYRLALRAEDQNDVAILREIQPRFVKKESIDKLLWEVYYKSAFDILTAKFFTSGIKICGIYKITGLHSGRTYIGQSVDIRERWRQHIKASLAYGKPTNKLYQAMQEEKPENFTFEIIEEVPRDKLNEREAYWIEFYKTKEYGLNSTKGNT